MSGGKAKRRTRNLTEERMVGQLDDLAEFEDFRAKVLPRIRTMLRKGAKAEDMYKYYRDMLAARKLSIALDPNTAPEKALTAITDIENRIDGKPRERKEIAHAFAQMPDQQLNSLLLSELEAETIDISPGDPEDGE